MKKMFVNQTMLILLCITSLQGFCQRLDYDTTVTGASGLAWNMIIHLPPTYYDNTTDSFQAIVFFVGLGEVGTDSSKVALNGPHTYIRAGWNGGVVLGNGTHYPIIISIQPSSSYQRPSIVRPKIDALLGRYRIKRNSLHMTGLSMGGWESTQFVAYQATAGDLAYGQIVRSVVDIEGVIPDDQFDATPPYPHKFVPYATLGGKFWGFEQCQDGRDIHKIVDTMNAAVSGSATYQGTCYGNGAHGYWDNEYGGSSNFPHTYVNGGVTQTIYQWMLRQGDTVTTLPSGNAQPNVNAGSNQSITLPATLTLTGTASGNNGATISSTTWTMLSGGTATITSPSSLTSTVTGLVAGTYTFQLSATDNHGLTKTSTVTINVSGSVGSGASLNYDTVFTIAGTTWNMIVHLPPAYDNNTSDSFQCIVYFVDGPQTGSDSSKVGIHGPHAYLRHGWDGSVVLGSVTHYPIIISIQTPGTYQRPAVVKPVLDAILARYRVKRNSLHLTGLVVGGWVVDQFVTFQQSAGDYTYGRMVRSIVDVEGVVPDDSLSAGGTYPQKFQSYASVGGKVLGLEQCQSYRNIQSLVNTMNATVAGSGVYIQTCFGNGTMGYSQYFYGDSAISPTSFTIGSISENIYQWMLRQGDTVADYHTLEYVGRLLNANSSILNVANGNVVIYPNPATDKVIIQWSGNYTGQVGIVMYDATGRSTRTIADRKERQDYSREINLNALAPGLYFLEIRLQTGTPVIYKVIKK